MKSTSPAHVVFDCDGVLVDSEPLSIEVDRQMLSELGWELSLDEIIERFVGRSHEHFLQEVTDRLGHRRRPAGTRRAHSSTGPPTPTGSNRCPASSRHWTGSPCRPVSRRAAPTTR